MKVKVLSSSSGWALPRIGCGCRICTSTDERDKRLRSSVLINDSILIDPGPDIYHQLLRFEVSEISAVVITHSHPDHILGLHDLIPKKCRAVKNAHVYGSEETLREVKRLFPNTGYKVEAIKEYKSFEVCGVEFTAVPVVHSKSAPTVGYVIREGDRVMCYFSDFRSFKKEDDRKYFERVDCLFLDGSILKKPFPAWTNRWGHISITEGIRLAAECGVKKTFFTHIGHRTMPHKELERFLRKEGKFYPAFDGLEIKL